MGITIHSDVIPHITNVTTDIEFQTDAADYFRVFLLDFTILLWPTTCVASISLLTCNPYFRDGQENEPANVECAFLCELQKEERKGRQPLASFTNTLKDNHLDTKEVVQLSGRLKAERIIEVVDGDQGVRYVRWTA